MFSSPPNLHFQVCLSAPSVMKLSTDLKLSTCSCNRLGELSMCHSWVTFSLCQHWWSRAEPLKDLYCGGLEKQTSLLKGQIEQILLWSLTRHICWSRERVESCSALCKLRWEGNRWIFSFYLHPRQVHHHQTEPILTDLLPFLPETIRRIQSFVSVQKC